MPTPANASDTYKQQIIDIALSDPTATKVINYVVGAKAEYTSVIDAIDAAALAPDYVNSVSATMSSGAATAGSPVLRLSEDASANNLAPLGNGTLVVIERDDNGKQYLGIIAQSATPHTVMLLQPLRTADAFSAVAVTVGIPTIKNINIMPGHYEDIDIATAKSPPPLTRINALVPRTVRLNNISTSGAAFLDGCNNLTLDGLIMTNKSSKFMINGGPAYHQNLWIRNCEIYSGAVDHFFMNGTDVGGVYIDNCVASGYFDVFKFGQLREFVMLNSYMRSMSYGITPVTQSCVFGIGTVTATVNNGPEKVLIRNNTLVSDAHDVLPGVLESTCRCIDFRNGISSNMSAMIEGNDIYVNGTSNTALAAGVACSYLSVNAADTANTPEIICKNNKFHVQNFGSGAAHCMYSANANYDILTAEDNVDVYGVGNGTNVTAVASWPTPAIV